MSQRRSKVEQAIKEHLEDVTLMTVDEILQVKSTTDGAVGQFRSGDLIMRFKMTENKTEWEPA